MIIRNPVIETPVVVCPRQTPPWKRWLDLVVTVTLLPLLCPLLAVIAVYIRCVTGGPVFFVQPRVGYGGETFTIYKFRTMRVALQPREETHRRYVAEQVSVDGPAHKPKYQDELIPGGKLLRQLSLDELPQLLNVLQGNMSLVGPRPDLLQLMDYDDWQVRRFEVLPGMTGLWQVSGKNRLSFDQMIELDLRYVEQRSLGTDLRILVKTIGVLVFQRNE